MIINRLIRATSTIFPKPGFFGLQSMSYYSTGSNNAGIDVEVKDGLRIIRLNRPKKKNSLTRDGYKVIQENLNEANTDDNTKLVVLTGTGDYFSSGNDLSNFDFSQDIEESSKEGGIILQNYVASYIDLEKPIIGLINGPAIGISVTVLGLFDAVYATERATFTTPFSILGQSPEGCSSYTFPKIMGYARANQFLLWNQKLSSKQAYECGLVSTVFPDDKFEEQAWKLVRSFAKLPLGSLVYSKALTRNLEKETLHEVNRLECERLVERWPSDDCKEAIMNYFMAQQAKREKKQG